MATVLEPETTQLSSHERVYHDVHPLREALKLRLAAVRADVRRHLWVSGLAWTWGTMFGLIALSMLADRLFPFNRAMRVMFLAAGVAVAAYMAIKHLYRPLSLSLADHDLAAVLDQHLPGVGQRVANVLELPDLMQGHAQASPAMVRLAVMEQARELETTDWKWPFDRQAKRRKSLVLAGTIFVAIVFCLAAPGFASLWAKRWLLLSNQRWPQHTYLMLVGLGRNETLSVPRGESVLLNVEANPKFEGTPGNWWLFGRGEPLLMESQVAPRSLIPDKVSVRYRPEGSSTKLGNFSRFAEGKFRYELPPVLEPTLIWIEGGDDWIGPIRIEPIDRPTISKLEIEVLAPGAKEPKTHTCEGTGSQLLFLRKSELKLHVTSSVPLRSASMESKSGKAPAFKRVGESEYEASWRMLKPLALEFQLVAAEGGLSSKPYFLAIDIQDDREPRVNVRSTGVGRRVTAVVKFPLSVRVLDDFGLTKVGIEVESEAPKQDQTQTTVNSIEVEMPDLSESDKALTEYEPLPQPEISLREYGLPTGTVVKIRGLAADNCAEGSQTGYSRALSFQVVTAEELLYEILTRQRAERTKFSLATENEKSLTEPLAALVDPEQAQGLLRKHNLVARVVVQVANRLDATLLEMKYNDVGSEPVRDLLAKDVIAPLRTLHNESMSSLRGRLDSLANSTALDPDLLEDTRTLQAKVVTEMERILKAMAQWESFVDVVNQLQEVIKAEHDVLNSTEQERKERTNDLFDDE